MAYSYSSVSKKVNMFEVCLNMIDFALEMNTIYNDDNGDNNVDNNENNNAYIFDESSDYSLEIKNNKNGLPHSKSIVFFKHIYNNLALISIISKDKYEKNNVIMHNINTFKQGVTRIFKK